MASWVVLEPPADKPDKDLVFVRDDFRWLGFIAPPLWLAWHRLWLEALVALAVLIGINAIGANGMVSPLFGWLSVLVSGFVGLEGPAMRIAGLRRRGYAETAAVTGEDLAEAELRYIDGLEDAGGDDFEPLVQPERAPRSESNIPPRRHAPAMGLFSYPGKN